MRMDLLGLLFPKYCLGCKKFGAYICPNCFAGIYFQDEDNCLVCNRPAIGGQTHPGCRTRYSIDGVSASVIYKNIVHKLVYAFKYQPNLTHLQDTLVELMYEGLIQKEYLQTVLQNECVLIPIPLHKKKIQQRGYNQAEVLAKGLSKQFRLPVVSYLQRIKMTTSQYQLSREDRLKNISGAFAFDAHQAAKIKNKTILLVDDLVTSGATMLEAAKILKKNGAFMVWGIAFAHGK